MLIESGNRGFDLAEILKLSDGQFARKFQFSLDDLNAKKSVKKVRDERDHLWVYVPGV